MEQLREAWNNDTLLSMASAFCAGFALGILFVGFFVPLSVMVVAMIGALILLAGGVSLLGRAERVRRARWQRREWR